MTGEFVGTCEIGVIRFGNDGTCFGLCGFPLIQSYTGNFTSGTPIDPNWIRDPEQNTSAWFHNSNNQLQNGTVTAPYTHLMQPFNLDVRTVNRVVMEASVYWGDDLPTSDGVPDEIFVFWSSVRDDDSNINEASAASLLRVDPARDVHCWFGSILSNFGSCSDTLPPPWEPVRPVSGDHCKIEAVFIEVIGEGTPSAMFEFSFYVNDVLIGPPETRPIAMYDESTLGDPPTICNLNFGVGVSANGLSPNYTSTSAAFDNLKFEIFEN